MYDGWFVDAIMNNLTIPAIIIIAGIFLKILQHYADKFVNLFSERQKVESVEKIATIRSNLIRDLDGFVKSAVASNMDMADKMKSLGHKLTPEQITEINDSAKLIIHRSLPEKISETMTPAEVLGGDHVMNALIDSMIEKHVLEYKISRGIDTNSYHTVTTETVEPVEMTYTEDPEVMTVPDSEVTFVSNDEAVVIEQAPPDDTDFQMGEEHSPSKGVRVFIPTYGRSITTPDDNGGVG